MGEKQTALSNVSAESIIRQSMKVPGVKIDRTAFLKSSLSGSCTPEVIDKAILDNPASAGISRSQIRKLADASIRFENMKTTALSAASGIPGGLAMVATVPVDTVQYFAFVLRILQKLAYLYGFPELELSETEIDDGSMAELMLFMGVMFGVQGAVKGVNQLARTVSIAVAKRLPKIALTKTAIYPIVKKIAQRIGVQMTKQIFANGVSKAVPIIGAVIAGSFTGISFGVCAHRLQKAMANAQISDPNFYLLPPEAVADADTPQ